MVSKHDKEDEDLGIGSTSEVDALTEFVEKPSIPHWTLEGQICIPRLSSGSELACLDNEGRRLKSQRQGVKFSTSEPNWKPSLGNNLCTFSIA